MLVREGKFLKAKWEKEVSSSKEMETDEFFYQFHLGPREIVVGLVLSTIQTFEGLFQICKKKAGIGRERDKKK